MRIMKMCEHSLKWANLLNEHDSFFHSNLTMFTTVFRYLVTRYSSLLCICVNKYKSELLNSASKVILYNFLERLTTILCMSTSEYDSIAWTQLKLGQSLPWAR